MDRQVFINDLTCFQFSSAVVILKSSFWIQCLKALLWLFYDMGWAWFFLLNMKTDKLFYKSIKILMNFKSTSTIQNVSYPTIHSNESSTSSRGATWMELQETNCLQLPGKWWWLCQLRIPVPARCLAFSTSETGHENPAPGRIKIHGPKWLNWYNLARWRTNWLTGWWRLPGPNRVTAGYGKMNFSSAKISDLVPPHGTEVEGWRRSTAASMTLLA